MKPKKLLKEDKDNIILYNKMIGDMVNPVSNAILTELYMQVMTRKSIFSVIGEILNGDRNVSIAYSRNDIIAVQGMIVDAIEAKIKKPFGFSFDLLADKSNDEFIDLLLKDNYYFKSLYSGRYISSPRNSWGLTVFKISNPKKNVYSYIEDVGKYLKDNGISLVPPKRWVMSFKHEKNFATFFAIPASNDKISKMASMRRV